MYSMIIMLYEVLMVVICDYFVSRGYLFEIKMVEIKIFKRYK